MSGALRNAGLCRLKQGACRRNGLRRSTVGPGKKQKLMHYSSALINKSMSLTVWEGTSLLFISAAMVFPRSYLVFKLAMFVIFLLFNMASLTGEKRIIVHGRVIVFYCVIAAMGLFWAVVGYINGGAFQGILDNLRLYVMWSVVLCVFFNLLLRGRALLILHRSIVVSAIIITTMNILAVLNYAGRFGYIPEAVIEELHMFVGVHNGYVQIVSHNIGTLFFITAYLMALQFRKDAHGLNGAAEKLALLLCLVVVILSGRRALWVAISMVPFTTVLLAMVTGSSGRLRGKGWLSLVMLAGFIPVIVVLEFVITGEYMESPTLMHLQAAFSASDERSIQAGYLIEGFRAYPVFGSGFGVSAGYLRSEGSPWLYELTYHQLLFNFGLVGISLFVILLAVYSYYTLSFIAHGSPYSVCAFSLFVAIIIFSLGAYSNPYFGSFDFLLLLGILPLISASFRFENGNSTTAPSGVL